MFVAQKKSNIEDLKGKKKILFLSSLIGSSWPVLFVFSYFLTSYQKLDMPPLWSFFIPLIYLSLGLFLIYKRNEIPFLKRKGGLLTSITFALLFINFGWSINVGMKHHSSINGLFLIFSIFLNQIFITTTGICNSIKKSVVSSVIQVSCLFLSYIFLTKENLGQDDIMAFHALWIGLIFFSVLNETMRRQLKIIEEIKWDLEVRNMELDDYSEHIHRLLREAEGHNIILQTTVFEKTKEIRNLLDHMNLAIFAVNEDYQILNPISKYSNQIFDQKIIGKSIFDVLYPNIKKDSREFEDISCSFPLLFGEDEFQFSAFQENLPKIVKVHLKSNDSEKLLMLSYSPILDELELVEKVLFIVEDISQSDELFFQTKNNKINFSFVKEIIARENEGKISIILEKSINDGLTLFNDLYHGDKNNQNESFYKVKLTEWFSTVRRMVNDHVLLDRSLNREFWYVDKLESEDVEDDPIFESPYLYSLKVLAGALNILLNYTSNAELFFPVFYQLDFPFIQDLTGQSQKTIDQLEFLEKTNQEHLKNEVLQTINKLILLFSFVKIIQEDALADYIDDLRYLLKQEFEKDTITPEIFGKEYQKLILKVKDGSKDLIQKIQSKVEKKKEEKIA